MRSASAYETCRLDKSVNFPIERFNEDHFINWAQKVKALETDASIFKNKYQMHAFVKRRRHWVFIIGADCSENLNKMILDVGKLASKEGLAAIIAGLQED